MCGDPSVGFFKSLFAILFRLLCAALMFEQPLERHNHSSLLLCPPSRHTLSFEEEERGEIK